MLKIKTFLTVLAVLVVTLGALITLAPAAHADNWGQDSAQTASTSSDPCHPERDKPPGKALTPNQLSSCEACNNKTVNDAQSCLSKSPIVKDINTIVNGLAGMVAVVCVIMIVLGGIKYSLARNNPQEISNARNHIINAVFAMICFMLIWALLQYLVPGGVFNKS